MKRIFYIVAFLLTVGMGANAQTLIERSDGTFTQGDQYLAALKTLSIPYGVAPTFDGGLARNGSLFFNTTTNKLMIWTGEAWEDVGKETDLSDYYTASEVDGLLEAFATTADMNTALSLKVDKTTTVNGKALSGNIVIEQADIPGLVAALAAKQNTITGAASTVVDNNLTANRAVISNGSGKIAVSPVTANELSYLGGVTSSVQAQLNDKIAVGQKGANNGVAPLNSSGKIPSQYVDVTTMEYMGTWNASTNEPVLSDATGAGGQYYRVTVGGNRNLGSGNITFTAGDDVIHNGTVWQRVPSTQLVTSVNGQTGNIVLGKSDVGLGNVDNTSDLAKPISTATLAALSAYLPLTGGNVSGLINFTTGTSGISYASNKRLGFDNVATIISGNNTSGGAIFLRPQGQFSTEGQVFISSNGQIITSNHGNSSQWNHEAWGLGVNNDNSLRKSNADEINHTSFLTTSSTFTGSPFPGTNGSNQGYLNTYSWGHDDKYKLQEHTPINSNIARRYRVKNDGVWSSWFTMWDSNNLRSNAQNDARYLQLTGGTVTGTITASSAPTAGGHLTNKTYVDNAITTAIAAAGGKAESVTVAATATYTLPWDAAKKAKFGDFGNFEVWLQTGGTYKLATVPISMSLSGGAASAYTFTLSNVNAIIVIK